MSSFYSFIGGGGDANGTSAEEPQKKKGRGLKERALA